MTDELGLRPVEPLSSSERAELDFLRYEAGHLQRRLSEIEVAHKQMSQDFRWTLDKLANSPAGPILRRRPGFQRMIDTWGAPPT